MPQDTGSSDNSIKLDTNELDSWLVEYTLKKEQIGLVHYAERLAQLIAQLGHDKSWDTLNSYFSEERNRRRLWTPNRDDECNHFLIEFSPDYNAAISVWMMKIPSMKIYMSGQMDTASYQMKMIALVLRYMFNAADHG